MIGSTLLAGGRSKTEVFESCNEEGWQFIVACVDGLSEAPFLLVEHLNVSIICVRFLKSFHELVLLSSSLSLLNPVFWSHEYVSHCSASMARHCERKAQ